VAISADALGAGGRESPARPLSVGRRRHSRRILADRWASRLVILGGLLIIASILAILFVIVAEVIPLFRAPTAQQLPPIARIPVAPTAATASVSGVDEHREVAHALGADGILQFVALTSEGRGGAVLPPAVTVPGLGQARVASSTALGPGRYLVGTTDGRVIPLEIKYPVEFHGSRRVVTPQTAFGDAAVLDPDARRPIVRLAAASPGEGPVTVAQVGPRELVIRTVAERKALVGGVRREESTQTLHVETEGEVTALALDGRGDDLFVGTSRGQLVRYDLRDGAGPALAERVDAGTYVPVTALAFLLGDRTVVVGDGAGEVATWQVVVSPSGGERRLVRMHRFEPHPAAVVSLGPSPRDKGFLSADATGGLHLGYGTSGRQLLNLKDGDQPLVRAILAPKADGIVTFHADGAVGQWSLHNPHPEITLGTLFGKVWYEGYAAPGYVWQSTGGTDDFEAKFSLTPLLYGTLKGTFYALLIAVPLALLAALYVSEFMHPRLKALIKPVVEIMAALPSVVLGFLAGLWLAPMVERVVPGLFLLPLVAVPLILGALFLWRALPLSIRGRVSGGSEVFLLVPVLIMAGWAAFTLGGLVEATLLGGDYRGWLLSALGLTYDQRNSLVVGVAMGFAVIPIIFTIAEDSLANVPQHLRAGSLALGATRWQTAMRIVLPTASPGIFSAIMIGFGRAVGETMIVLMATGNTPVMDWSIFNGFRALSANIAVELPEAPEGGTLFRVLFLAAFLLFCLTFALNTLAELIRLRLRQKYRYL
jgi:phosphate transport system permease protein